VHAADEEAVGVDEVGAELRVGVSGEGEEEPAEAEELGQAGVVEAEEVREHAAVVAEEEATHVQARVAGALALRLAEHARQLVHAGEHRHRAKRSTGR